MLFTIAQRVHSQNMIPNSGAFYDIRDTTIAVQNYCETVPLLDFANQEIRDSVEAFVAKAISYFVDSAGYAFTLALQYEEKDSSHIHIYIHADINLSLGHHYYMREYRASYVCEKAIKYTYGCVRVGEYYIFVETPNYLVESEVSSLFKTKSETQKICIHRIPEEMIPLYDDSRVIYLPHSHFALKTQNPRNYVSPRCD